MTQLFLTYEDFRDRFHVLQEQGMTQYDFNKDGTVDWYQRFARLERLVMKYLNEVPV